MASRRSSKSNKGPEVLSGAYLERAGSKNEILRRLTTITETLSSLSDDDPDLLSPSTHPGLLSLSTALVSPSILSHRDKDVRLHAVLAACELFYIFAPEPPWEESEILQIFEQLIRQLGNLHATSPENSNFESYYRILEQLSEVKIGVVLVDLIRTERGGGKGEADRRSSIGSTVGTAGEEEGSAALETLCELLRTLLHCAHVDHPPEVAAHAELAVAACIEEFEGSVPVPVLEEILTCVGDGPVVWVTNPAYAQHKRKRTPRSSSGGSKNAKDKESTLPPQQIQQTNPSYLVAAKVLRRTEDKISSPIAALLNGLLTGDPNVVERTSLSTVDAEAAALLSPKSSGKKKKRKNNDATPEKEDSPTLASHLTSKDAQSGANVYAISYELHRIAPQILTTVIGTVSTSLVNQDLTKRWQATKLLGRLFGARTSDIAERFGPCFREWLRRSYDPERKVRETMVKALINFLTMHYTKTDLCADVNEALATIITRDPTLDIRLLGIHQVCDLAHTASSPVDGSGNSNGAAATEEESRKRVHPISIISAELLHAVGDRVSSKNKTEHRDAITGLAQIYFKHYLRKKLVFVQEGGDDVSIDEILEVWNETRANNDKTSKEVRKEGREEEEKFAWIPQRVFECVSFPDSTDAEMRSRIFQIVDDVLLGSGKSKDSGSGSTLTPTSRAVGLALIITSVKEKDNAFKWMCALFTQRSRLQHALGSYLDARSRARECESGSAEAFTADSEAMEKLELVASLSAPVPDGGSSSAGGGSGGKSPGASDLQSILKKLHSAKDKHIFRILSTIAQSTHSSSARIRAFEELPKRTKSLGTPAQTFVKTLARRCAMGAFLNAENIEHCIILAQECFEAEECEASAAFLECVKVGTSVFPSLGSTEEGFKNLVEFFDHCRTADLGSKMKKEAEKYAVVTTLSEIMARSGTGSQATTARPPSGGKKKQKKRSSDEFELDSDDEEKKSSYDTLHEQLLRLCTRDGTPEQARNSVYTIASMIQPPSQSPTTTPGRSDGSNAATLASRVRKEKKEFEPLLKALVNPSRISIPDGSSTSKTKGRIVSVLSAIAAIAECAPYAFNAEGEGQKLAWGRKAIEFCLDRVLLGKNAHSASMAQEGDSDRDDSSEELSPTKKSRSSAKSKKSKGKKASIHCQMLCGAIEVLVCHIRSTIVHGQRTSSDSKAYKLKPPSSEHIKEVFTTLAHILEEGGVPPSSVNGRYCETVQDKAELRRAASVNLLRLCDANLKLEGTYLTPRTWHILSSSLVDSDKSVRSSIMEELASMYTSSGKFRSVGSAPLAPSLRFVSLVTLCADGDHGTTGAHSAANGNAANVGQRLSNRAKSSASQCIRNLRTTCQTARAQCRNEGRSSERKFETQWKRRLMPEYCVPYALHLLAFRQETASVAGTLAGENDSDQDVADESGNEMHLQEASQKMLKKRLKWLFDPLIQSLGPGADNISFLLRMVELIGKHPPINVLKKPTSTTEMSTLDLSDNGEDAENDDMSTKEAAARMIIICQFAREVLLSHVKKDVNLTVYPGSIQIPGDLYSPRTSTSPKRAQAYESDESEDGPSAKKGKKPKKSISHYVKKRAKAGQDDVSSDGHSGQEDEPTSEKDKSVDGDKSENDCPIGHPDKSADAAKSVEPQEGLNLSSDTHEHSPSFPPLASPLSDAEGFKDGLGDVSPIAKADSPVADTAPRDRKKRSAGLTKTSGKKKRKSKEIDVFDEFLSPAMTDGGAESSDLSSQSPDHGKTTTKASKKPKTVPSRASKSGAKKSKAAQSSTPMRTSRSSANKGKPKSTEVSVPVKTVMVNLTNSASSSGSTVAGSSKKKRVKMKALKTPAEEDGFDFSVSSAELETEPSTKGPSRKKSVSAPPQKVAPARKARAPAKSKVSPSTGLAKKRAGAKGKASASKTPGNKTASKTSRRVKATPEEASPSTTSEANSASLPVRRGGRRSVRAKK